ncbi:low-complexity tail membrane protein [Spirulina sp. CS-785/01]|uniref:low-complexity tail membrane protein n=1 Tax=Spirulina sp. CS-785/01 TaxID=3021716 RepID=UPI00232F69F9|nr:low-complexity tail membrane protein [Spirulina sp. CS-785/01]MDB9315201.1 low-complexity tail membrane protein [Spirulina sp. CS-785/01]
MNFRLDPYLWLHLAGLAVLPIWLLLVWLGIAAGSPLISYSFETVILVIVGLLPILWMQWTRPFEIYSFLLVAVQPKELTTTQRKILSLFKSWKLRVLSIPTALFMVWVLWQLYQWAPLAATATPISPRWHILGLGVAAIAFLLSNLFIQVPVSVLSVLLTPTSQFNNTDPYDPQQISQDFTLVGFPIGQFLPTLPETEQPPAKQEETPEPPTESPETGETTETPPETPTESPETGETVETSPETPTESPETGETVEIPPETPTESPETGETVETSPETPTESPETGETTETPPEPPTVTENQEISESEADSQK